jgi:ketosteroid isomerase-like protein
VTATGPLPGWATSCGQVAMTPPAPSAALGVADRLLITELIARYGWAYDERDREALAGCFTADAVWQGVIMGRDRVGPIHGAAAIADWLAGFWDAQTDQRRHVFTNIVIGGPDAERVTAHAYLVLLSSQDGATAPVSAGPYRFTMRRTGDESWHIAVLSAGFDAPF